MGEFIAGNSPDLGSAFPGGSGSCHVGELGGNCWRKAILKQCGGS